MLKEIQFSEVAKKEELLSLKKKWLNSLNRPPDGMWESFRNNAKQYAIKNKAEVIGYACIGMDNQLLQFYLLPKYMDIGVEIFAKFKHRYKVKKGMVGTNNPIYLSLALHFMKDLVIHTYLFDLVKEKIDFVKEGTLRKCTPSDLERIVVFCQYSIGAPATWLFSYIGDLIDKNEIYVLEKEDHIIGTCEVRKSIANPKYADIGMIVSPDFRKQGYGAFLLNEAKNIAIKMNKTPICSCEKDNIGSMKSIQKCGFASLYQLLSMNFK